MLANCNKKQSKQLARSRTEVLENTQQERDLVHDLCPTNNNHYINFYPLVNTSTKNYTVLFPRCCEIN